jgi:hypothetical protein
MCEVEREESLKRLLQDFTRILRAESNLKVIIAIFFPIPINIKSNIKSLRCDICPNLCLRAYPN